MQKLNDDDYSPEIEKITSLWIQEAKNFWEKHPLKFKNKHLSSDLRTVLEELMSNAIKATIKKINYLPDHFHFEPTVHIYLAIYEDFISVEIEDSGLGLPKELFQKKISTKTSEEEIFSPNYKAGGNGLKMVSKISKAVQIAYRYWNGDSGETLIENQVAGTIIWVWI